MTKVRTTGFSASFTVLVALALCGPVHAGSPDVMITDANIAAGRLVITGKAATAGMKLRLDGKTQAAFNTVSRYDKSFSLALSTSRATVSSPYRRFSPVANWATRMRRSLPIVRHRPSRRAEHGQRSHRLSNDRCRRLQGRKLACSSRQRQRKAGGGCKLAIVCRGWRVGRFGCPALRKAPGA